MEFCTPIYLPEIAISRLKPVGGHTDAHDLSFRNITSRSRDGSLIITTLYDMIRGNYQIVLGTVITEAGNSNGRSRLLALFLVETAISKSLKDLQLAFDNIGVPVRSNDIKFFTERDVPGDGFLEKRTVLLNMDKLFRIVFAGEGP